MFAPICGGYHPCDKFVIYHWDDVIMDYNTVEMTLDYFASERLLKSYVKRKVVLQDVIKRISHGLGLHMIFIQLVECFPSPSPENTQIVG